MRALPGGGMSDALLSLRHVSLRLNETDVLENVNLSVQPGEIVTLIGPNGAGKTSLVRVVLGLLKATSGEVRRRPRLRIGYMPQKLQVDPSLPLTVLRFLLLVPGVRRPAVEAAPARPGRRRAGPRGLIGPWGG